MPWYFQSIARAAASASAVVAACHAALAQISRALRGSPLPAAACSYSFRDSPLSCHEWPFLSCFVVTFIAELARCLCFNHMRLQILTCSCSGKGLLYG